MRKIRILILILCTILVSSAYAEVTTNDPHTWETEAGKFLVCSGSNSYVEFNNGNSACSFRYGDNVIASVRNNEYKQLSGCGLTSNVNARLYLCIYPDPFNAPVVTVDEPYVWEKSDGNFAFCDGTSKIDSNNGTSACGTKYSRNSASSLCNSYKSQEIGCGILAEARMCQCIFPDGVSVPEKAIFSVNDITPIVPAPETPAPSSSSSSSSGGSSSRNIAVNSLSKRTELEVDTVNGVGRYLDLGNKGTFEFKGEKHTIYVKQIKEDNIVIVFESNPIEVELKTGETKQIDINTDGKNDLNVKLVNIYNGMAEVLVKEITEKKVELPKQEETKTEEKKGLEGVSGSAVSKPGVRSYAIGATLVLLAGIFVVLVIRIVKRDNKTDEP
mgnify:CR=1 FL=1